MKYPIYARGSSRPQKIKEITIKGKANVLDPKTMVTPTGVVTEISEADLEVLKQNPAFQRHCARGFLRVMSDPELNTKDMQARDNSSQLMDSEYANATDPRIMNAQGAGACQATAGEGDRIRGQRGIAFVSDTY